jgi:hypothetical protein
MKSVAIVPIVLCLALGACAAPTAPSVVAVAADNVSDRKSARDAADCRARAQPVVDRAAANGDLGLQRQYNFIYAQCMTDRGYQIEAPSPRVYDGPGPYYWGPGPYGGPAPFFGPGPLDGPTFYYGVGWGHRW